MWEACVYLISGSKKNRFYSWWLHTVNFSQHHSSLCSICICELLGNETEVSSSHLLCPNEFPSSYVKAVFCVTIYFNMAPLKIVTKGPVHSAYNKVAAHQKWWYILWVSSYKNITILFSHFPSLDLSWYRLVRPAISSKLYWRRLTQVNIHYCYRLIELYATVNVKDQSLHIYAPWLVVNPWHHAR